MNLTMDIQYYISSCKTLGGGGGGDSGALGSTLPCHLSGPEYNSWAVFTKILILRISLILRIFLRIVVFLRKILRIRIFLFTKILILRIILRMVFILRIFLRIRICYSQNSYS